MGAQVKYIRSDMTQKEMRSLFDFENADVNRGIDLTKHAGKLEWRKDALSYQREIRKEWDREIKF